MATETSRTEEATDLLQHLIRNRCVNEGTVASGHEHRSAELLHSYLAGSGAELETFEPEPGRTSLVAKLHGHDPDAPSLTLLGHTDVVPATADDWSHDPFGGELIEGEVWGRGAIDMLNLTATMATSFRHLAQSGFRPAGDLTYVAVADEEALGTYGARWLCRHAVAATDRSGRRGDHLAVFQGLLEGRHLRGVDPVAERGVHHDGHIGGGEAPVLLQEGADGLVELGQAGQGTALGGDVGAVDDDTAALRGFLFHRPPQSTI